MILFEKGNIVSLEKYDKQKIAPTASKDIQYARTALRRISFSVIANMHSLMNQTPGQKILPDHFFRIMPLPPQARTGYRINNS